MVKHLLQSLACVTAFSCLVPFASAESLVGAAKIAGFTLLIEVDTDAPLFASGVQLVRGLPYNANLIGLDARPATGELYAVVGSGSQAQLYSIDETGLAEAVGEPFSGLDNSVGTSFGFDFNPTLDQARLVSSGGQNLVFNPDDGTVTEATDLAFAVGDENEGETPEVAQIAYDNNTVEATETVQRGIDIGLDALVTVDNDEGTLETIGSLGYKVRSVGGFDVSGETGVGFAVMTLDFIPLQLLFEIDLETGAATPVGIPILNLLPLSGATIVTPPSLN